MLDLDVHTIPARPAKGEEPAQPAHDHFDLRFLLVASSPLTRSSYHAGDDFAKMRAAREAKLAVHA